MGCPNAANDCPNGNPGTVDCPNNPGVHAKGVDYCPSFTGQAQCGVEGTRCGQIEACQSNVNFSCIQGTISNTASNRYDDHGKEKPRWYLIHPDPDCSGNYCVGQRVIVNGAKAGVSSGALGTIISIDSNSQGCNESEAYGVRFCLSAICPADENLEDVANCVKVSNTDGLQKPSEIEMRTDPTRKEELLENFQEVEHCGDNDPDNLDITCDCDELEAGVTATGNGYGMLCMSPLAGSNTCYSPNEEILYDDTVNPKTQFPNDFYSSDNKCAGGGIAKCFQGEIPCRT